ncbi:hikeshi-like protein [Wolffia australiana]
MFGVVFPDRSFPMDASSFTQIDPLHWVLDMNTFVGEAYQEVKEVCIFLLNALSLPAGKALAVYVQAHGNPYIFCGAVHGGRPSALLHLPWPDPAFAASPGPPSARIGVCLEDFASLPAVADAGALARVERLALRVGENLFNFMQSFCVIDGNRLVVTADILDRWFIKFQERAKRDPEYIKSFSL